ncbi:MAG: hypothetical protein AAFN59_03335, partial [Pseudomonadota bacterium]
WRVAMRDQGRRSEAQVTVLAWSDLVRSSMQLGVAATYVALFRTAWIYISTGALMRLARLRKGPMLAALLPVVVLLGGLVTTIAVTLGAAYWVGWWLALPAGLGVCAAVRALDRKVYASYLMQDYAFSAKEYGAYPDALEHRLAVFAQAIQEIDDVDEILIVGHSSGAYLAVSMMADLLRAGPRDGPHLSLLTLGQVVPMVSLLPKANRLRDDLAQLAAERQITWVDVSAPGDGCSFALTDPVTVSGVHVQDQVWPLVLSAAYSQTLSPDRLARLRHRYFRLHFQYLCAFDDPTRYDYFAITAGAVSLRERFSGRRPSPSRLQSFAA